MRSRSSAASLDGAYPSAADEDEQQARESCADPEQQDEAQDQYRHCQFWCGAVDGRCLRLRCKPFIDVGRLLTTEGRDATVATAVGRESLAS